MAGIEGWLGQRAGIDECFHSLPFQPRFSVYENAFHQSPTKYIHGDPKISTSWFCPSESSLSAGWPWGFSMKSGMVLEDERCQLYVCDTKETPASFFDRKFSYPYLIHNDIAAI